MQNSYILRNKNNEILYFYHTDEKCIFYKKYRNGYLIDSVKIIEQVSDNFTVSFYKTGEIYLICQGINGDVILCKEENEAFIQRIIFKNEPVRRYKKMFQTLVNENGMTIIYNTNMENSREELLVKRHIGYEQKWTDIESIDSFIPFNLGLFKTQKIKDDYIIILYQKKERENILGYREITQNKLTSFNIFHKTTHNITDQTFLATDSSIHFLYIVKNVFSSQVIYRKRDSKGLSRPVVLYEGNKLRSCSLAIIKNTLYAFWVIGSNLFFATSTDNGDNFSHNVKNSKWLSMNARKVEFICFNKMRESEFIFNEVYIDSNDFTNIGFIREEYPEFFNTEQNIDESDDEKINNISQNYVELPTNLYNKNILQDNFLINFEGSIESFFAKNSSKQKFINKNFINNTEDKISQNENKPVATNQLENEFDEFSNFDGFKYFETPPTKDELVVLDNSYNTNNYNLNREISSLQNRLSMAENQLSEKNKKISELNNIIKSQNNERDSEQAKLREQIKILEEENNKIIDECTFRENNGGTEIKDDETK